MLKSNCKINLQIVSEYDNLKFMAKEKIKVDRWRCTCDREKCGGTWISETEEVPRRCAKCGREHWDKDNPARKYERSGRFAKKVK